MLRFFGVSLKSAGDAEGLGVFSRMASFYKDPLLTQFHYKVGRGLVGVSIVKGVDKKKHIFHDEALGGAVVAGNFSEYGQISAEDVFLGYKKDGCRFFKGLKGVFSVVLWEHDKGCVFLVNDRFGFFPLYYHVDKEKTVFSTVPDPILLDKSLPKELDLHGVAEFLRLGYFSGERTFLKGLSNLTSSSVLRLKDGSAKVFSQAGFFFEEPRRFYRQGMLSRLEDSFFDAIIRRQSVGKESFSYLTGGRDTRFILAHLLKLKKSVRAITFFSNTVKSQDLLLAKKIATRWKVPHIVILEDKKEEEVRINPFLRKKAYLEHKIFGAKGGLSSREDLLGVPVLSGFGGGEVLGRLVEKVVPENDPEDVRDIFSASFLKNISEDPLVLLNREKKRMSRDLKGHWKLYLLISKVCRSFINTIEGAAWEQPTHHFINSWSVYPFMDELFLKEIFSIPANCLGDKTYLQLYERYYPAFLKIPFQSDLPHSTLTVRCREEARSRKLIRDILNSRRYDYLSCFKDPADYAQRYPRRFILFYQWLQAYGKFI